MTECQFHNNCGGYCETEEEKHMNLCCDCLDAEKERDREAALITSLNKQAGEALKYCANEQDVELREKRLKAVVEGLASLYQGAM